MMFLSNPVSMHALINSVCLGASCAHLPIECSSNLLAFELLCSTIKLKFIDVLWSISLSLPTEASTFATTVLMFDSKVSVKYCFIHFDSFEKIIFLEGMIVEWWQRVLFASLQSIFWICSFFSFQTSTKLCVKGQWLSDTTPFLDWFFELIYKMNWAISKMSSVCPKIYALSVALVLENINCRWMQFRNPRINFVKSWNRFVYTSTGFPSQKRHLEYQ